MRRLPSGPAPDRIGRPGRLVRLGSLALTTVMALSVFSAPATVSAQATKKAATAPTPLDPRPLSRYVPRDNLLVLVEFQGLDLQADAWSKTAASKMLNGTPLGEMLEAMGTQLADRAFAAVANKKMGGADVMTVAKHALKSGFIFAFNPQSDGNAYGTLVIRNGTAKEVRPTFSRLLGQMMGASKPQIVKTAGRSVIAVPMWWGDGKDTWAWWAEQNDLVVVLGKGTEDVVAAIIDGTRPNGTENPVRSELLKADNGFTPNGQMFIDLNGFPAERKRGTEQLYNQLSAFGLTRLDFRWGFQDDALMSVWRLKAPKPRKGMLALFDQPAVDKTKLPPLPEGVEAFTVVALEPAKILDNFLASAPDPAKKSLTDMLDTLKSKSRIDVRKDLLSHIGPKVAFFTMPGAAAKPPTDANKEAPPPGGNPLAGLLGGMAIPGMSGGALPKFTLLAEVDDAVAFGKSLDTLMVAVNRELKTRANEQAKAIEAESNPPGGGGGPGVGVGAGAEAGTGRGRGRGPGSGPGGEGPSGPVPTFEFKLMPGKDKIYQLSVPSAIARQLPPGFRPTIRLGPKHLVVALTPESARTALEIKPGSWTVPADLAPAFDRLSQNFTLLSVSDPRGTMPELLASLPSNFQRGFNTLMTLSQNGAAPGGPPGGGPEGGGPGPGGMAIGGPTPGGAAVGGGPTSGSAPMGGYRGQGGSGGSGGSGGGGQPGNPEATPGPGLIQFNIEPAKLPNAEDLRSKMFPATFSIVIDDQEIRLVSRASFPNLISPTSSIGIALALPAIQAARQAAMRAAGIQPGAPGSAPGANIPPPAGPGPGGQPGESGGGRPGGKRGGAALGPGGPG